MNDSETATARWRRQQRQRRQDGNNDDKDNDMRPSPLQGRGHMSFTAVYPQDDSRPCKNSVMARKRVNDTIGNGKEKEKDPQKIVGSCVETPVFQLIAEYE